MKRIIALVLSISMLLLVGCNSNTPNESTDNTTANQQVNNNTPSITTTTQPQGTVGNDTTTTQAPDSSVPGTTTETTTNQETTTKEVETTTSSNKTETTTAKHTETTTAKPETTTQKEEVPTSLVSKKEYDTSSATQIVYYPTSLESTNSTYPVVAWANGTMCPPALYDGLLQKIAESGYIVVACDETMAADGTAQIASLNFMLDKNNDSSDIFYNKVNTNSIGVMGHSQGGRSSVNAAVADSRIDCVVSLAGSNYDYEVEGLKAPTFFIAGTSDMVVSPSQWIEPAYNIAEGPTVYASLNGAMHTTCTTDPAKYSAYIIDWLDSWLKNDKSALTTFKNGGALSQDSAWVDFRCKGF